MQSLIPLALALSLATASSPLSLLPYAYLASPVPVYQQYQNSQTGEHAFSYAGGPSAKEEIKGADGVLRGSYSYIDANGILQSVFYVADDNGFRVAATNLPTDDNLTAAPAHIVLARSLEAQADSKSRKRRSILEDSGSLVSSNSNEKILLSGSATTTTSQNDQSNVQKIENVATPKALYQPLLLTGEVPLATSHQSQVQVHSNARVDLTEAGVKPVDLQPVIPVRTIFGAVPLLARAPTYHENRIELHKNLGIEGAQTKDAVKIDPEPLTFVQSPQIPLTTTVLAKEALPLVPVLAKESLPLVSVLAKESLPLVPAQIGTTSVTTSVSSHGISQIHGPSAEVLSTTGVLAKEAVPVLAEKKEVVPLVPLVKEVPALATATATASISSHGISQIHGDSKVKLEPTLLVRTAPLGQLHQLIDVPLYLH